RGESRSRGWFRPMPAASRRGCCTTQLIQRAAEGPPFADVRDGGFTMNERQRHRALEGREPDRFERPAVADDRGVNRADYRGDFGPEGDDRFGPPRSRDEERHWWRARHDERRRRRDGE